MIAELDAVKPNLRRAALALHALSPADRKWVFEQLDEPQRRALEPLLAELAELGIPPDAQLLRQALAATPQDASMAGTPDVPARSLARAIQAEPAALRPWLLAVLAPARRRELLAQGLDAALQPAPTLAPALADSLRRALHERALAWPEAA